MVRETVYVEFSETNTRKRVSPKLRTSTKKASYDYIFKTFCRFFSSQLYCFSPSRTFLLCMEVVLFALYGNRTFLLCMEVVLFALYESRTFVLSMEVVSFFFLLSMEVALFSSVSYFLLALICSLVCSFLCCLTFLLHHISVTVPPCRTFCSLYMYDGFQRVNPLNLNTTVHLLVTFHDIYLMILVGKISLNLKTFYLKLSMTSFILMTLMFD